MAGAVVRLRDLVISSAVRRAAPVDELQPAAPRAPSWSRGELAGRLVELSGTGSAARLTAAVGLVLESQRHGEPTAWITVQDSAFFPPDVARSGVDLDALVVVRVAEPGRAARAAERLLRSGAFGLVVIDLAGPGATGGRGGRDGAVIPIPMQGRLVGLAQRHDAAIVCLTDKGADAPSIGSMISLRAEALRVGDGGRFGCKVKVLKDKRRGPGWGHAEELRGPDGLR
jgi:recombination protein RecA